MSEPPSYSDMWKPGSSTSSSNTRNKPVVFQRPIQQKAPSYKAPSDEQVNPRAKKSYIKSIQDEETAKPLSIGASTHGMSKKVDWEVDETITLKEDYDMSQLPDSPCCKNLLKLSIQVSGFTEIPPTFFEHMPLLEELDLSTTNIQSLPSSISSLTLLQKLFLRGCSVLMELPSEIGMLTKLKLLDCEGSEIMYIPKEIGELNELEVLRVSLSQYADYYLKTKRVNDPVIIPRDILSKLNKLKELCITTCPEAEWWEEEVKEIQDDLCHLEYLETLKWYLPTKMVLDQFLQINREGKKIYENLSNFTLTIGRHPQLTSCLPANLEKKFEKFEKCLKWINAEGNEKDISMIMERAEALFLSRHWTIVRLSDFHLAKLKYCLLAECNEMETLVKVDEFSENFGNVGLESIEYLTVHDMEKFQCIWNGPMGKDSLLRLRILALHACPKLTTIFTINIAQNLSCLTELTIEDCPNVTSLISDESPNIATTGPLIPCLEKIFLLDLPNLDSAFRGKIILEKVDSLLVYNCLKLQYLSVTELPNIQKIKGEREWWNDLKCDKSRWQNVFEQLKEERKLIEQLAEATNSLQRFHDILSRDAKGKKPLDRFSLGVLETKSHTSNFPIGEQEGLPLSQPDAKDENPLDRFTFGVTPTKGQSSNFPIGEQEGLSLSQQAAKDEKLLDRSALGVSEIKSDRSIFHLEEQEEAVSDANKAIELDPTNSKAYLRKGTACFNLEEYQTAKTAFEAGAALVPEDARFSEGIKKCDKCIAEENSELPTQSLNETPTEVVAKTDAAPNDAEQVNNVFNEVATNTPAKPKYRHELYQKPEEAVVTIFVKGIPADCVTVNFGEQILSVRIELPGEEAYVFQTRLFGKIIPAKCRFVVLSTKIEIRLAKVEPNHWTSLEFSDNNLVVRSSNASLGNQRPTYPSSKKTKDWDKLEALVKKEEKDEKLDGDAALNKFFRDIYSDADEETRRAMKKSFVESNGTVLSTNWKEVGSKQVEGTAPDGMELRKWEY